MCFLRLDFFFVLQTFTILQDCFIPLAMIYSPHCNHSYDIIKLFLQENFVHEVVKLFLLMVNLVYRVIKHFLLMVNLVYRVIELFLLIVNLVYRVIELFLLMVNLVYRVIELFLLMVNLVYRVIELFLKGKVHIRLGSKEKLPRTK